MGAGTYDYIVVGAGSAGCVLANRLTVDDGTVLVLEAGSTDDQREISIPAAFPELFRTDVDWEYYTETQPELDGRELYWPRGKVLGGSSSMNAMIHVRGHRRDDQSGPGELNGALSGWARLGGKREQAYRLTPRGLGRQ